MPVIEVNGTDYSDIQTIVNGEMTLDTGVPLQFIPATTTTVYNPMLGDDCLFVSSHGDLDKKWLRVEEGDYCKFATTVFFLQNSNGQVVLPYYETF